MKKLLTSTLLLFIAAASFAQNTQIVAHRGAWKNTKVPQNSIASLEAAIKGKYWGSEFDVCLTKDNILIVNHNNDYQGTDVATTDFATLSQTKLSNGEKLPTAEEYMKAGLKDKKITMVYEIKANTLGVERSVKSAELSYKLVKDLKALKQTVFISFSYDVCLRLRELDKKVRIQYLGSNKTPQELYNDKIYGIDFNYNVFTKNPTYIKDAQAKKMQVNVWTVNEKEMMQSYIDQKVDYITTDEPEVLQTLLK